MNYEAIAQVLGTNVGRIESIHEALGESATEQDIHAVATIMVEQRLNASQAVSVFRGEAVAPKTRRKASAKRDAAPKQVSGNGGRALSKAITPQLAEYVQGEAAETRVQAELYYNQCLASAMLVPGDELDDPRLVESRNMVMSVLTGAVASSPLDESFGVPNMAAFYGANTTLQLTAASEQ